MMPQKGVIENTPLGFAAAIDGGYGIECDLQISADGEAMVHHDDALGRLTDGTGRLDAMTAAELKRVPFKATADRMMTLGELCDLVAGRAPLVIELKSRFAGDRRLVGRAAKVLAGYGGPVGADVVRSRADRGLARDRAAGAARPGGGKPSPLSPARAAARRGKGRSRASWCKAFTRARISSPIPSTTCPPRCRCSRARFWRSRC